MLNYHLAKADKNGLGIEYIGEVAYHCSEAAKHFLVKLLKDYKAHAITVYKVEFEAEF